MSVPLPDKASADAELRALLTELKAAKGATYEQLADGASMSRGAVGNYIATPEHRRDPQTLEALLAALGANSEQRDRALRLNRVLTGIRDSAKTGWLARAIAADCSTWTMAEFTATEATVHTAIGRRQGQSPTPALPSYVPRAHDKGLRRDITAAAQGDLRALIIVRGTSSTGKTRSLWEAVQQLCAGWAVIRPRNAGALRNLPRSGLFDRPCVVWLNELQGFLGPNGHGLSLDVLRDLYAAANRPVLLVGTLWPEKLRVAADDHDDRSSDSRDLLRSHGSWVRWHDVPRTLSTSAERSVAREMAITDSRLARALADPDRFGFAQTLAGAQELLDHYFTAPEPARLLLEAAADARRLGHSNALSSSLLHDVALALWRVDHGPTSPPNNWFADAISYAVRPLRGDGGVRALVPVDDVSKGDQSTLLGYGLADYLEQHLTTSRRQAAVTDAEWESLLRHTTQPSDLSALATAAQRYSRHKYVEALHRAAAEAGDPEALRTLAWWLTETPEREAEGEALYREAAAAGDQWALHELAGWFDDIGRDEDAEATFREAIHANKDAALLSLASYLSKIPGRETEAEAAWHKAAEDGHAQTFMMLAWWLERMEGRENDVEAAWRSAAAADDRIGLFGLITWLKERPGRQVDVAIEEHRFEAVLRREAATGAAKALRDLAEWLTTQPGQELQAEEIYRKASAAHPLSFGDLARWLSKIPDRQADVETVYREAAALYPGGFRDLAGWLGQNPERQADVEAVYREAANAGEPRALRDLAGWLTKIPGRESEVEGIYREAAAAGDAKALVELADWLVQRNQPEAEVEGAYREAAASDAAHFRELTEWLSRFAGREEEVEAAYREAAAAGERDALVELADWLSDRPGRETEAEQLLQFGIDAYGRTARSYDAPAAEHAPVFP